MRRATGRVGQGIRANQHKAQHEFDLFLSHAIDEIRSELKGKDMDLKARAVLKMVYVSLPSLLL